MGCRMMPSADCVPTGNPRQRWCVRCGAAVEESELDPRTAHDPAFQRGFLKGAEQAAGLDIGWADAVSDRVGQMQVKHGERYRTMPMRRLLREIDEEAFDLGGWPMLAALVVNAEDLDPDVILEIKHRLQGIAALAVRQSAEVQAIRELLT